MPTNAHTKFIKTVRRCEQLVESYKRLKELDDEQDAQIPTPKDIVRGAIVLAVAALDTYVTDAFSEKLVPYLRAYTPDQSLIDLLFEAGLDTNEALQLLAMDRPYRRIRTLVEGYYASYTTQKFEVIDQIFLPYRLQNIVDNSVRRSGLISIKRSVEILIERRHQIAHAGDYNRHGRIVDVDEEMIGRRIRHLEQLVTNMDAILCNRIG